MTKCPTEPARFDLRIEGRVYTWPHTSGDKPPAYDESLARGLPARNARAYDVVDDGKINVGAGPVATGTRPVGPIRHEPIRPTHSIRAGK